MDHWRWVGEISCGIGRRLVPSVQAVATRLTVPRLPRPVPDVDVDRELLWEVPIRIR